MDGTTRDASQGALGLALAVLAVVALVMLGFSLRLTGGHFTYALDDAYIHLAIARHLAESGVWGVTPFDFNSASSSIAWPILLGTIFSAIGVRTITPFVINLVLCIAILVALRRALAAFAPSPPRARFVAGFLLLVTFVTPLPAMAFGGMDNLLHVLVTVLFAHELTRVLAADPAPTRIVPRTGAIYALAFLLTACRYEGLFLIGVSLLLLLLRRRPLAAGGVAAAAAAPVILFGAYSLANGSPFLPNPVLLKGALAGGPSLVSVAVVVRHAVHALAGSGVLLVLLLLVAVLFLGIHARGARLWDARSILPVLFVSATLAHVPFSFVAPPGRSLFFARYDAYLVVLGLLAAAVSLTCLSLPRWPRHGPLGAGALVLLGVAAVPFVERAVESPVVTVAGTRNIHEQQIQMGRFLRDHYAGEAVVANDIGAINYLADIRCIDLIGLGTDEVMELRRRGAFDAASFQEVIDRAGAGIAIAYRHWLEGRLGGVPPGWIPVAEWGISRNVVVSGSVVTFYATHAQEVPRLVRSLEAFDGSLPRGVTRTIFPEAREIAAAR